MALCSSPGLADAETATIGTCLAQASLRRSFTTVQPSSFGSCRSRRMSCGRCSRASSSAAKPSVATVASCPACLTIRSANSRLFGSSSTTRIFATAFRSGLMRRERQAQCESRTEPEPDAARRDRATVGFDDETGHVEPEADSYLVLRRKRLDPAVLAEDRGEMW